MKNSLIALSRDALFSLRDLAPIVIVIAVFQIFVVKQPVSGFWSLLIGGLLVVAGLAFFIFGLRIALFPIGEDLAHALAKKGSAFWLFTFAFVLGFGTTIAEPALLAVAEEAAEVAVGAGVIANNEAAIDSYALGLRLVVALSVGVALVARCVSHPDQLVAASHDHWGLRARGHRDNNRATGNRRRSLRLGRCYDINSHRSPRNGAGCGSGELAQGPQPDD